MMWKVKAAGVLIVAVAVVCSSVEASADRQDRPNIVFIFIDDMGYGDIGPFGSTVNKTPELDRMAEEGITLTQYYVSATACTPSRSALMTGCYADRIGMDGRVNFPSGERGLNPKEITIAELLKTRGYATGCFGKWHLGDQPEFMPLAQGFDEYLGIPYSNDMWSTRKQYPPLPLIKGNRPVAHISDGASQALLCKVVTDGAVDFIKRHSDEPFFLYVPHAYIHGPRFAREELVEKAEGDVTRAQIEEVDWSVGRILKTLKERGLAENTLVLFTSDNGGSAGTSMGPLRGKKGGPKYEGHMRVPTVAWWPGQIAAGSVTDEIAATIDMLPTFAALAGAETPKDRKIDGYDISNLLLESGAKSPHEVLYYEFEGIRRGPWKLVRLGNKSHEHSGYTKMELYNLDDDLGETNNLTEKHPDIAQELNGLLDRHLAAVRSAQRPAAFVENPEPLLESAEGIPSLAEYLGLPDLTETSAATRAPDPPGKQPPNIVFILADDQGWNALSRRMDPNEPGSGSAYYQTPRLAQLALEGMRFSQAYSPAPTCSPTRHAIQFGRSPASLNIFGEESIKDWDAVSHESLANVLKNLHPEYVCAHLGKWHIGRAPGELGYDVHDGSNRNAQGNSKDPEDPKLIFDLSRKSNAFMEKQVKAGKPFFLQISHYADHLKYQALQKTITKYETEHAGKATEYQSSPLWAAMNENLDSGIGKVLDKIDELGIADNTYVIYTADNGYEAKTDFGKPVHERGYYKAYPQRSHKYHVSEGGIRVPFIVRGPGIPANTHSGAPVVGTDVFATVMDIAGGFDHLPELVEGASLLAHLKSGGRQPVARKDPFLVFKYSKPRVPHDITIVQGNYKLIKDIDTGRIFLFNLKEDIGERDNLADAEPERAKRMYDDMTAYFNRFGWSESQAISKTDGKKITPRTGKVKEEKQVNVTGKWVFELELDMGASGSPTFDFVQDGQTLTGAYSGRFGQADLKGTVKDGKIQFEYSISQGDITYSGTVDTSGSMSGTADYGGQASGTWTATKQD